MHPPAAAGHAESPETKRRLKSLLEVSGLTRHLQVRSANAATDEDLLRVHTPEYLRRFKAMSIGRDALSLGVDHVKGQFHDPSATRKNPMP